MVVETYIRFTLDNNDSANNVFRADAVVPGFRSNKGNMIT